MIVKTNGLFAALTITVLLPSFAADDAARDGAELGKSLEELEEAAGEIEEEDERGDGGVGVPLLLDHGGLGHEVEEHGEPVADPRVEPHQVEHLP